jgi:hypothetical protein
MVAGKIATPRPIQLWTGWQPSQGDLLWMVERLTGQVAAARRLEN